MLEIKSLEDYAIALCLAMVAFRDFKRHHIAAHKLGILPEDLQERLNVLVWDLDRMLRLYDLQMKDTMELLPDNTDFKSKINQIIQERNAKNESV